MAAGRHDEDVELQRQRAPFIGAHLAAEAQVIGDAAGISKLGGRTCHASAEKKTSLQA